MLLFFKKKKKGEAGFSEKRREPPAVSHRTGPKPSALPPAEAPGAYGQA